MTFFQLIQLITALYLAHLNPVTNAHVEIINELKKNADKVKVMPVVFKSGDKDNMNEKNDLAFIEHILESINAN